MLKKIVYRVLRHRHFWRDASFDELSELYVSMMFRGLSISLTGLFIPVYLWQLHYPLTDIFMISAWYFTFRAAFLDISAGFTIAKIGPKHTMLIGHLFLIGSTVLFLTLPQYHWSLWLLGGIWGASASFFFIPFHVDFSKIKHSEHGGKELGFINVMERTGGVIGPIFGGLIATIFGAHYIFLVATVLLIVGLIPLFRTAEPVRLNQKLKFTDFRIDKLKHDFISCVALGLENQASVFLWPLFLGVFVLGGRVVYAKLGIITSISFVVSILIVQLIGRLIDKKHGRQLLRISTVINALLHILRPFTNSLAMALGVNLVNEAVTPGYRMPYLKGLYDAADDQPGYRIVYLTSMETIGSVAKATMWWLLAVLATFLSARSVMSIGFIIAALASLTIMSERFKALDPGPIMKASHE